MRMLIARAPSRLDSLLQHRARFVVAIGPGQSLRGHEVAVGVVRMRGKQVIELGSAASVSPEPEYSSPSA